MWTFTALPMVTQPTPCTALELEPGQPTPCIAHELEPTSLIWQLAALPLFPNTAAAPKYGNLPHLAAFSPSSPFLIWRHPTMTPFLIWQLAALLTLLERALTADAAAELRRDRTTHPSTPAQPTALQLLLLETLTGSGEAVLQLAADGAAGGGTNTGDGASAAATGSAAARTALRRSVLKFGAALLARHPGLSPLLLLQGAIK